MIIIWLFVIGSSIWVAVDANALGVKRGQLKGGFADMSPFGWFLACFLIWIVAFPMYLAKRPEYQRLNGGSASGGWDAWAPTTPSPAAPVPTPMAGFAGSRPDTGSVFCTACGTQLPGHAAFCAQCGQRLTPSAQPVVAPIPPQSTTPPPLPATRTQTSSAAPRRFVL